MSLTYDQKSEIRMAFDEAYVAPERRRDVRVKHRVNAEISAWKRGKQGLPFNVSIEDFSPTGGGLTHSIELQIGSQYLLRVPRPDAPDLVVVLTVVRCQQRESDEFHIGLELDSVIDRTAIGQFMETIGDVNRLTSRRTKVLLMLLGIFGISMAMLIG